jgi:hypothetical protein
LTHLCPALYPQDLQKAAAANTTTATPAAKAAKDTLKKYRFDSQKIRIKVFTSTQLAQAQAARCGAPIALPVPATPVPKKN